MEWKKVERQAHNFKETPELVGVFAEKVESQFDGYDFVFDVGGKSVLVFGKTALQTKMSSVKVGDKVKIVALGEKKSEKTGRNYEDFDVFVSK